MDHTKLATCEACSTIGPCEIFGSPKNPKAMLLCIACTQKEIAANDKVLADTQRVINEAREIDSSIRYNGDVFNAKTLAIATIRTAIFSDPSLTQDEKHHKLHEEMTLRIEKLRDVVFSARKTEADANVEILVIKESLREFGNSIRAEFRERIKQADTNYQPNLVVKIPKISKPKLSPMDRLVESLAVMQGISKDDALKILQKGPSAK